MQPQSPSPFSSASAREPRAGEVLGVPRQIWVIAIILALLMTLVYVGFMAWGRAQDLADARARLRAVRAQLAAAQSQLAAAQSELDVARLETGRVDAESKEKFGQFEAQLEALRREKEAVAAGRGQFEREMRAAIESKDVTISQLQGRLTVNILDRIMFESGEAVLKPDGEAVLLKVASVLRQHSNFMVQVVGHTDNIPIRASARSRFASNWELSSARALAAVRFLSEKGGVDPRKLGAVGYGEYHPIADNSTEKGRAMNRRIAITVVPDEIAVADAVLASPSAAAKTNAAAVAPALPNAEPTAVPSSTPVPAANEPAGADAPASEPLPEANP